MRYLSVSSALAFLALLMIGCGEGPASPATLVDAPAGDAAEGLAKIGDAPPFTGVVLRGEGPGAIFTWVDPANGRRAVVGLDMEEFCSDGAPNFDFLHFQTAFLPNGRRLLVRIQEDDRRASVWPFADFDCDLFTTVEPLASGVADFLRFDSDFCRSDPRCDITGEHNAEAWGMRAHGRLTRPDGTGAVFSGHFNVSYRSPTQVHVSSKIVLK